VEIVMAEVGDGVREMSMKKGLALPLAMVRQPQDEHNSENETAQMSRGERKSVLWLFV
jgi:hypothetical protein